MKKQNWEILSLTRFLLALIVMIEHLMAYTSVGDVRFFSLFGAFEAVLGFLLISGFSIGKSIIKSTKSYLQRRIKRIYPVYLASIIFQIFVLGWSHIKITTILINLLFLNQIVTDTSFVGVGWTLQTEVMLYALAPIFLFLNRRTLYILAYSSFILYCLYTCGRSLYHWNYYAGTEFGINLFFLSFIWIAGFALAVFNNAKDQTAKVIAYLFIGHLLLQTGIQVIHRIKIHEINLIVDDVPKFIGQTICLCFVYYVVIFNERIKPFSRKVSQVFDWLGNISYPLYLTHCTTFLLLTNLNINNEWVMMFGGIIMATVIYYIFDFYSKKRVPK